jgi:hypothetical protein
VLTDPGSVSRIRSVSAYRDQPDLDVYNAAFNGMVPSRRFAGTDIDGFSALVYQQPLHGLWERNGYFLIQEHKKHAPSELETTSGQFKALAAIADVAPDRIFVVFTYGPARSPELQQWQRLWPGGQLGALQVCTSDPETWAHRHWIRKAKSAAQIVGESPLLVLSPSTDSAGPRPSDPDAISCMHCATLTTEIFSVGKLDDNNDTYKLCAICWRMGVDPDQSKRMWAIRIAKRLRDRGVAEFGETLTTILGVSST